MTKPANRKAVIYCRVSDSKQKSDDAHGLESQEFRCREYALRRAYEVVRTYHDDISGKHAGRPALSEMLVFLQEQKERHMVLIDDTTRLARSMRAHLSVRDAITMAGGQLESPTKTYEEDPEEDIQELIEAAFSGHQRRVNAKQTVHRMKARLQVGFWQFPVAIGYKSVKVEGQGKTLIRDEPVASVIQEVLEGYASGRFQTQTEAMRFLANHPQYPEKRRRSITRTQIAYLLSNQIYTSFMSIPGWGLHMIQGLHEPLISLETHLKIKERMAGRANAPARQGLSADFALRGAVFCTCGRQFKGCWSTSRNGVRHPYYLCQSKGTCEHYGKSIRRDVIEGQFSELLASMRPTKHVFALLQDMLRTIWDSHAANAKLKLTHLQLELRRLETELGQFLDRIVKSSSASVISAYEKRIEELETEKLLVRERIANCGRSMPTFEQQTRTAFMFLENPQKLWVSDRIEDKRAAIKLTFADKLIYERGVGYRTALTTSPFKVFSNFGGEKCGVVPLR